jgi:GT2 family glycosyltransferase
MFKHLYIFRRKLIDFLQKGVLGRVLINILKKPAKGDICIVAASRCKESEFWTSTMLGKSMANQRDLEGLRFQIYFENQLGLSQIYNTAIKKSKLNDVLVFVHDDVWIEDDNWITKIRESLSEFDIVGVAGNVQLKPEQPAWCFMEKTEKGFTLDKKLLRGSVSQGTSPSKKTEYYFGDVPAECKVLDGLLFCAKASALRLTGTYFDPRFSFDFYDLDFCRSAGKNGLRIGVWNMKVIHNSGGSFKTKEWNDAYDQYLQKWNSVKR